MSIPLSFPASEAGAPHWSIPPTPFHCEGPGIVPGSGHWVKHSNSLLDCNVISFSPSPRLFLRTVILGEKQVSSRLQLGTDAVTDHRSLLFPSNLLVPAPERIFLAPCWFHAPRLAPPPPCRFAGSYGVRWEAAPGRAGAGENWSSGLGV